MVVTQRLTIGAGVVALGALLASFAPSLESWKSPDAHAVHNVLRQSGLLPHGAAHSSAPSGNYAPSIHQTCPSTLIRQPTSSSNTLSSEETAWVAARRANVVSAWESYLTNPALELASSGFDVASFVANTANLPNVAIATSGGGYRAMLHGAGMFNAFDGRNASSVAQGTGGVLQLATYMAGLSGGSWWTGSLAINNFPTVYDLAKFWNLEVNLIDPSGIVNLINYYVGLQEEIDEKRKAGAFDLSLTDYWGAALSRHLVNATKGGAATTFSSIQNLPSFSQHTAPLPILIAESRILDEWTIPTNTSIFEFTPFEFGSWNPSLQAFLPMEYLGTAAVNGVASGPNGCVVGYDNAGYLMGTSATLFNQLIYGFITNNDTLKMVLGDFLKDVLGNDDFATYPNPFGGLSPSTFADSNSKELELVDGGEDSETLPLWPLIHPERNVDVILGLDAPANTAYGWPDGSSIVGTGERMKDPGFASLGSFPTVPADSATFINLGLNSRPTFFGCDDPVSTPLVVYLPNRPYTAYTNFSTYQFSYTQEEIDAYMTNAFHEAADNLTSIDPANNVPLFPTCLACALVLRAERRAGMKQTSACQSCFNAYCWNGESNSTTPSTEYDPSIPGVNAATQAGGAGTKASPTPSSIKQGGSSWAWWTR
ncbi:hypothetical protein DL93DRAFT_2080559 [Clavulina sp. PMI_390]|nr:hypothetical protein DL93DRAFT_2080559 [Clavulina sp. PMI_390]